MLKAVLESLDGLSEELQQFYEKRDDGKYHLLAEGMVSKAKLNEFRENNTKLLKEMETLKEKYKDVDPEKYQELQEKMQEIEDNKLIDAGKIDELVNQRTERMRADFESKSNTMSKALEEAKSEASLLKESLKEALIDARISTAVSRIGKLQQGAIDDVIARARRDWKIADLGGQVTIQPVNSEGGIRYGKDGKEPLKPEEWVEELAEQAPYLFVPSKGAGASGSDPVVKDKNKISMSTLDGDISADLIDKLASGEVTVEAE